MHEQGVAARDQAGHKGRLQVGRLEEVGKEVTLQVVDRDQGQVGTRAEALGKGDAHDQRAHEAGTRRHADGGEVGRHERVAAKIGARLRHGLLVHADNRLGVLAARDLGHHTAEARVEVNLRRDHVCTDVALAVDHGHGRLVTGGLDGEDQRCRGGKTTPDLGAPLTGGRRPGADGRARLRALPYQVLVDLQGQVCAENEGVLPLAVVVGAAARLGKAERRVQRAGGLVAVPDLQRDGLRAQHLGVVSHAREQAAGHAGAAMRLFDRDVVDLEIRARERAARESDHAALVVRDPPGAAGLRELLVEHVALPRRVDALGKDGRLELGDHVEVVHGHGAQLQVDRGERVVHTRHLDGCRRLEPQALAFVFLRVGQSRVDGQDERGVAVADTGAALGGRSRAQQALARRQPERLVHVGRKARRLEARTVLGKTAAREPQVLPVRACGPVCDADVRLHDRLGLEGAVCALVVEYVDAGIDLAAHRVGRHSELAAHTGRPRGPRDGVERRGAVERGAEAAGQALARGDADADARERAGSAPDQHGVHVAHRQARLGQHVRAGGHELHVCLAAAEVVARGEHLHGAAVHARDGARQHIGRSVEC